MKRLLIPFIALAAALVWGSFLLLLKRPWETGFSHNTGTPAFYTIGCAGMDVTASFLLFLCLYHLEKKK